eukprot:CAMPEP_0196994460 /NCGR_PEP_ID=MMETSP1380-20130617/749_1 /TAXON_ID=5936 /ORGANISM="Euplotes crassus, Strain CT5" /LENGTH=300 /DNA_ID=CAMNT_0042409835 /DNA_START=467 /DNA_END=1369 /DNA_ORIENTATION=+
MIVTNDGVQKHGRLPPIKQTSKSSMFLPINEFDREKSVQILMDQTDEMDNSIELYPDEFRNTYKSNFGKSDITSEFDFTVDGKFKNNNLQQKFSFRNNLPGGVSPSYAGARIEEKAPSVVQFRDYANMDDIIRKSQTSKPFGSKKRTSQDARIDIQKSNFNRLRESNDKKSLAVQGSTLKRKNSQTESDIYNDLKSDILMQTHGSKFNPSRRKSEGGDIEEEEQSKNLSMDDNPNSVEANVDAEGLSQNSNNDEENLEDILDSSSDDEFDVHPISSTNINGSMIHQPENLENTSNVLYLG